MKTLVTTISLATVLAAALPAAAVTAGTFDPRDPNSLARPAQAEQQKPYALTGSARRATEPNDTRLQVNSYVGSRAVIANHHEETPQK
jgi:hypothetical protein